MRTHPTTPLTCQQCGLSFQARLALHRLREIKFCSRACYHASTRIAVQARFLTGVERTAHCWLWAGRPDANGYGRITIGRRSERAHCVEWSMATGSPVPDGLIVGHICDVRLCVRNDDEGTYGVAGIRYERSGHLWLGPNAANMADMAEKGRGVQGERHHSAVLRPEQVIEARRLFVVEGRSIPSIARWLGISHAAAQKMLLRRSWKHLE
jgi:hypothetical protein